VSADGRELNVLGTGDHLGEIAAIDLGTRRQLRKDGDGAAAEPTRLLAFPASALRELLADAPEVDRGMRRIAHARLATR
jgi:CRP-like cAMP-binding protein